MQHQQPQINMAQPSNGYTNTGVRDVGGNLNNVASRQAPATAGASAPPPPPVSMQNAPLQGQPAMVSYAQPVTAAPQAAQAPQYSSNTNMVAPASDNNFLATLQNAQGAVNSQGVNPQLQLLQQLAQQVSPEQFAGVIAALGIQLPVPPQNAPPPPVAQQQVAQLPQNGSYSGQNGHAQGQAREDQDFNMYQRERSRSPDFKRRRVSPPNRRESPTYGVYDPNQPGPSRQQDNDRRGRGRGGRGARNDRSDRNEYRQRTPPRERPASPSMLPPRGSVPKVIEHDYKLPAGWIRGNIFS
jgi:protein NRD1